MGFFKPRFIIKSLGSIALVLMLSVPVWSFGKAERPPLKEENINRPLEPEPAPPEQPMPGSFRQIALDEPQVMESLKLLKNYLELPEEDSSIILEKAEYQVVAGSKIRLYYRRDQGEIQRAVVMFFLDERRPEVTLLPKE